MRYRPWSVCADVGTFKIYLHEHNFELLFLTTTTATATRTRITITDIRFYMRHPVLLCNVQMCISQNIAFLRNQSLWVWKNDIFRPRVCQSEAHNVSEKSHVCLNVSLRMTGLHVERRVFGKCWSVQGIRQGVDSCQWQMICEGRAIQLLFKCFNLATPCIHTQVMDGVVMLHFRVSQCTKHIRLAYENPHGIV